MFTISYDNMILPTVLIGHSPHRTNSTRPARLIYTQAALSSSNNAEFPSSVLESRHDSKMVNVLLTVSSESRIISRTVELFIFNDTPSWNCSLVLKLCFAKSSRKVLSNITKKMKTNMLCRKCSERKTKTSVYNAGNIAWYMIYRH